MNQQPSRIEREYLLNGNSNRIIGSNGQPIKAREYHFINKDGKPIVIQEHSLGHSKGAVGPHFNVRPHNNPKGYVEGTHGHYNF